MKNALLSVVAAFLLFSHAYAQNMFPGLQKFGEVATIESDFKMEQHLSIAEDPFESSGKFYFQKPSSLKWEYAKPFNYGFIKDGDRTLSWQKTQDGNIEVKDISNQRSGKIMAQQLYVFITMDINAISKTYAIEEFKDGITLYPKDNSKGQLVEKISISFDENIAAVKKVEILNRNGDKTIITFSNTKIDGELPENAFSF